MPQTWLITGCSTGLGRAIARHAKPEDIARVVKEADARFGRIDVLVNNASVGYFGSFEESDMAARSGTIVNLSSIGGLRAMPSLSFYAATKHAVEALSESLSRETAKLGIKVLIVEPGPFRTDWAGRSAGEAGATSPDYADTAGAVRNTIRGYSGKQPGDPARAAQAIDQAVNSPNPPLRLLLGKVALQGARTKIDEMRKDFDAWAKVTEGADFPD